MPLCRCGLHLADLRDTDEQLRWAERLGECWDYNDKGRGFWFFCVRCHAQRWPNDRRYQNRHSHPAPKWPHIKGHPIRRA